MSDHPAQPNVSPGYVSYLLRLWHIQSGGDSVLRASLEEPLTRQVLHFNTLPSLFDFLLEQTRQSAGTSIPNDAHSMTGGIK